jgi:heptosyltransferase-2
VRRLVVAPNWLGDCVMSLPVLRALRRNDPGGTLAVLARPSGAPVFRAEASADTVWVRRKGLSGLFADGARARQARFDEVWVLPHSFRSALLAFLTGARRRLGYATDGRRLLLTHAPARPEPVDHQLHDEDALLASGGVEPDSGPPRIAAPPETVRRAEKYLDLNRLAEGPRPILVAPGAAFGPTKLWPAERFALLADALMDEGHRAAIVIGPDEVELGRLVARRARHRIPVLGADLDTGDLLGVLSLSRMLIGNDSGPAHLAAATGVPVLVFFGPTDPARTRPTGGPASVLDRYVFCSPCYLKICPYRHECMEEISIGVAAAAARRLLEATAGS